MELTQLKRHKRTAKLWAIWELIRSKHFIVYTTRVESNDTISANVKSAVPDNIFHHETLREYCQTHIDSHQAGQQLIDELL